MSKLQSKAEPTEGWSPIKLSRVAAQGANASLATWASFPAYIFILLGLIAGIREFIRIIKTYGNGIY